MDYMYMNRGNALCDVTDYIDYRTRRTIDPMQKR